MRGKRPSNPASELRGGGSGVRHCHRNISGFSGGRSLIHHKIHHKSSALSHSETSAASRHAADMQFNGDYSHPITFPARQTPPYPHPPIFEMGPSGSGCTLICANEEQAKSRVQQSHIKLGILPKGKFGPSEAPCSRKPGIGFPLVARYSFVNTLLISCSATLPKLAHRNHRPSSVRNQPKKPKKSG